MIRTQRYVKMILTYMFLVTLATLAGIAKWRGVHAGDTRELAA